MIYYSMAAGYGVPEDTDTETDGDTEDTGQMDRESRVVFPDDRDSGDYTLSFSSQVVSKQLVL